MKKLVLAAAICALVAACGSEQSGTITGEDGESADYTVNQDGDGVTATVETGDGKATISSGANVKVDLPDGFTVYPGATIISNTVMNGPDGKGAMVMMQSKADPSDMVAFYRKAAEAAGYTIAMEMKTDTNTMIAGEKKENKGGFSFSAGAEDGTTNAQLMVGDQFQ